LKFKRYGEHDAAQQMQVLIKCGGYIETWIVDARAGIEFKGIVMEDFWIGCE
jgi:hypothetical protein